MPLPLIQSSKSIAAMDLSNEITPTPTFNVTAFNALIVTILISIVMIITKLRKQTTEKKTPLPPGPVPWPIVGNVPEMLRHGSPFRWIHQIMKEMNSDICLIRLGNTNIVPVQCPRIASEMLRKQDAIFASRPISMSSDAISGGYLTAAVVPYGDQWKKMRRVLKELIGPARHKWLHDKRAEEAENLVFYINNQYKSNQNVNLRIATQQYCGNVIRKMIFSKRFFGKGMPDGGPGTEELEYIESVILAVQYVFSFCISDYMPYLLGLDLDGQEKIVKHAHRTIRKYQNPLIDERIQQWNNGERKEAEDLLDVLISLKDTNNKPFLTPDEIKNQVVEIIMAAVDNPSNNVEWAMAEMINQPELIQKATEEIDRVIGKDRLVQESDIGNLKFVKACAKEAYRLHPTSAFIIPHVSMEDTTVAGYFIPKGSHALFSRYGLGRNPNVWENPLKFNPERHLIDEQDQVVIGDHDLKLITFSTGRRGCVASLLGSSMTVLLLARLLQCFTWSPPGNSKSIDISEADDKLTLAMPLVAFATPRLATEVYPVPN